MLECLEHLVNTIIVEKINIAKYEVLEILNNKKCVVHKAPYLVEKEERLSRKC